MPKGKKRRNKKNNRRAAVNKRHSGIDNMFKCIEILMKHNNIKSLSVKDLPAIGGYDFTFEPDKDYSGNEDVKMICECLGLYMDMKRLERMELTVEN